MHSRQKPTAALVNTQIQIKSRATGVLRACPACIQQGLWEEDVRIKCDACNHSFFRPASCLQRYFLKSFGTNFACEILENCEKCLHTYSLAKKKKVNFCEESLCTICENYVLPNHQCYVQNCPLPKSRISLFSSILSVQWRQPSGNPSKHIWTCSQIRYLKEGIQPRPYTTFAVELLSLHCFG